MKNPLIYTLLSLLFCNPSAATTTFQRPPIWAEMIAGEHCRQLRRGLTWDQAINRAVRGNKHWMMEVQAAGPYGTRAIAAAFALECGELNQKALRDMGANPVEPGREVR